MTDVEISRNAHKENIINIANKLNIHEDDFESYGKYKGKISCDLYKKLSNKKDGKLILITSINPTPLGEGKTTVTIGLGDALNKLDKNVVITLREPSLGPVFGIKGGATGGGYSQVVPMDEINLHFTGDMHAITTANNLIAACIDNHIFHGNELKIDINRVTWKRCIDMNDRALRDVTLTYNTKEQEFVRKDGFDITSASEIMAIFCLANDLKDLEEKISNIIFGYSLEGNPLKVSDLNIQGACAAVLKDAFNPNLVQTLENTPAIIHGGPFANIAHGCNSIVATKTALKLGDYVVTEAGFGADLGAEKFLDIKCRKAGLKPDCIVIATTLKALKYNGGVAKTDVSIENLQALETGFANLKRHVCNMNKYGIPVVIALNKFNFDTEKEIETFAKLCDEQNYVMKISEGYSKGSEGCIELANAVLAACDKPSELKLLYNDTDAIKDKIEKVAKEIYHAKEVEFSKEALEHLEEINKNGFSNLPVCIAKTQYSFSDDAKLLNAPEDFTFHIRDVLLKSGAGFVVAISGSIMTMPGLPKLPAAENIFVNDDGEIEGIF